jgi:hypothetical protein
MVTADRGQDRIKAVKNKAKAAQTQGRQQPERIAVLLALEHLQTTFQ